jgi:hypothetical protein
MKKATLMTKIIMLASMLSLWTGFSASAQTIKAQVVVTQATLDSLCGTHNIKLVFTSGGYMYFVDFSAATTPQIQLMTGISAPYFPVISSDGRWVTYQTGSQAEGPSTSATVGKSWFRECAAAGTAVMVADSSYVPRFVQNTSADTPEVLYSTSVACPQGLCYNGGQTLKKKVVSKVPLAAEVVYAQGSYYGGLSWDNRFLNSGWEGGPNGFMLDMQDASGIPHPTHTMRTLKVKTDSLAPDTFNMIPVGTCNTSRSASHIFTNTMLYFDFGSAVIRAANCYHPLLGTWKMHEKLFISRYDMEDVAVYDMPVDRSVMPIAQATGIGEVVGKQWDNPEWSNHPYFAAANLIVDRIFHPASGWQHTTKHESVYLLHLKDSAFVKLIQSTDTAITSTTEFLYPFVWVDTAGLTEDAAWLSRTIWEKAGITTVGVPVVGVKRFPVAPRSAHTAMTLWSNTKATRIVVYSALGQQIAVLTKTGNREINPANFLNKLHNGIYFIGIESQGQKRQIVRWVNSHQ